MRIITGEYKGRKLNSPVGDITRPTSDRVKESLFNIISKKIHGSTALDLFSGIGNLGLECISRGCSRCFFIEKNTMSYKVLNENIEMLNLRSKCETFNTDAFVALESFKKKGIKFDIVFLDPPYFNGLIQKSILYINNYGLLNKDGIIISEYDGKEEIGDTIGNIMIYRTEQYGRTKISFWKEVEDNGK